MFLSCQGGAMKTDRSFSREDVYTHVTNEIIKAIECGVGEY